MGECNVTEKSVNDTRFVSLLQGVPPSAQDHISDVDGKY